MPKCYLCKNDVFSFNNAAYLWFEGTKEMVCTGCFNSQEANSNIALPPNGKMYLVNPQARF